MKKIWKYKVPMTDQFTIDLPVGAQLLTVQLQYQLPYLWAIVDPEEKRTDKLQFFLFGTGNEIDQDVSELTYVGSFMTLDGKFIWHLFVQSESLEYAGKQCL